MSTGALPSVLRWTAYAKASGAKWGIPPAVLLGLTQVESGGVEGRTSSTGAKGLTQFEPSTARQYNVDVSPGHAQSQIEGAAHYLHDLGYAKNPALALASYNAGPGNPGAGAGYAQTVLATAKLYGANLLGKTPTAPTPETPAGSSDLIDKKKRSGAVQALLTVGFIGTGALLVWQGANSLSGGALGSAAHVAGKVSGAVARTGAEA